LYPKKLKLVISPEIQTYDHRKRTFVHTYDHKNTIENIELQRYDQYRGGQKYY